MVLKVYNTLSRKKEIFKPIDKNRVNMFVCGPTVYDYSHLGHAKTYVQFDIIVRYLRYRGFVVFYLQNITDIDDKIIQRAKELKVTPKELAQQFENEYYKDMNALGITSVDKYARATDYIQAIIEQVKTLLERGYAYIIEDGIYFDLSKFPDYGKLSGRTSVEAEDAVSRIDESVNKRNKGDFCLWKRSKPDEPKWDSPWFKGRPGWHIEDTAITESHFGPQYDIHGGARDLIFPHHEAEIAQMEAKSGKKPFVKYWLHTGFLTVEGRKMAKSLGNFITIRDALKKYDAEVIRLFFASTHYRSPIDFNQKKLEQSKKSLERLYTTLESIHSKKTSDKITKQEKNFEMRLQDYKKKFINAMDNDFNSSEALKVIFEMSNEVNKFLSRRKKISVKLKEKIFGLFRELGGIFGILQKEIKKEELPEDIKRLIDERERARKKKDWKTADAIRSKLKEMGILLEDTPEGVKWKVKES
jgi:cysteinyl-tRNA synthetase